MSENFFNLNVVHPTWQACLSRALRCLESQYLHTLKTHPNWLPGADKIFNAFSLPLSQVNYVIFGESPYPRADSANGYAFWDARVKNLWSSSGLDKKVNRATSLRNLIKMLILASGKTQDTSQAAIAALDKTNWVQTNSQLFENFLHQGFLLLNATPVLQCKTLSAPQKDARAWLPFTQELLYCLIEKRPKVKFLLFGRIAEIIDKLLSGEKINKLCAEHPYNLSFISNPNVLDFFRPLQLLDNTRKNAG